MQDRLISVIVPVYNVEQFLRECLDSILAQSYKSFELILVNDGSTDDSGNICNEYAKLDNRIRVIHKSNGGLSSARNTGLDVATGDYICFIDSDDSVSQDYLLDLFEIIDQYQVDMVFCDIDSLRLCKSQMNAKKPFVITAERAWKILENHSSREYVQLVVAWNKIYSRRLFEGLRYPLGRIHEDDFMINDILKRVEKIAYLPKKLYKYRENPYGITGCENETDIRHLDAIDAYIDRMNYALSEGKKELAKKTLKIVFYKMMSYYFLGGEISVKAKIKYKEVYEKYKDILTIQRKIKYGFFIISPEFFWTVFRIFNKKGKLRTTLKKLQIF